MTTFDRRLSTTRTINRSAPWTVKAFPTRRACSISAKPAVDRRVARTAQRRRHAARTWPRTYGSASALSNLKLSRVNRPALAGGGSQRQFRACEIVVTMLVLACALDLGDGGTHRRCDGPPTVPARRAHTGPSPLVTAVRPASVPNGTMIPRLGCCYVSFLARGSVPCTDPHCLGCLRRGHSHVSSTF